LTARRTAKEAETNAAIPFFHQSEADPAAEKETILLRSGRSQLDQVFNHNARRPLDDSEFIPLVGVLINSFEFAGLGTTAVRQLRRHACETYHRWCQQNAPETTLEEDAGLMLSYLPKASRAQWHESLG
jgi:hypothetical protein